MDSSRVQAARTLYAAFNNHDIPGILALLDPAVEWDSFGPDFALAVGTYKGRDGVAQFFKDLMTQQTDTEFTPMEFCDCGATVHCMGIEKGTLNDSKLAFLNHWDHTLWFNDGNPLVVKFRANYQLSTKGDPA